MKGRDWGVQYQGGRRWGHGDAAMIRMPTVWAVEGVWWIGRECCTRQGTALGVVVGDVVTGAGWRLFSTLFLCVMMVPVYRAF